jgi:hypothetical protein
MGGSIMNILTNRAQMLLNNDLTWYVCTTVEGELALHHSSALSAILECGEPASEYGFETIEQCWNGEDLSDENDWEEAS